MPIVAIDLTPEETARIDLIAEREKRARKAQVHVLALRGLEAVEADQAGSIQGLAPVVEKLLNPNPNA